MTKLSFIIPAYNAAPYVAQTIESILMQSDQDHEIIVIDDGSTDETPTILRTFDGRIRAIHQENRGLAEARNRGIVESHGEWVTFLDADDVVLPEFEREMLQAARAVGPEIGAIFCSWQYVDTHGAQQGPAVRVMAESVTPEALLIRCPIPPHAAMVRRKCLEQVGGFDPLAVPQEDWDFWLRIAHSPFGFCVLDKVLVSYRQVPRSLSRDFKRMRDRSHYVLDKFFAVPNLDPQFHHLKAIVYGLSNLTYASNLYRVNQPQKGRQEFIQTVQQYPALLNLRDTYYEMICAEQPRPFAGSAIQLDLRTAEDRLNEILSGIFNLPKRQIQQAYKVGYLCLGELAYQQGNRYQAISYARRSVQLSDKSTWRLLLKALLGERFITWMRFRRKHVS